MTSPYFKGDSIPIRRRSVSLNVNNNSILFSPPQTPITPPITTRPRSGSESSPTQSPTVNFDENTTIATGRVPIHAAAQIFRRERLRQTSINRARQHSCLSDTSADNNFFLPRPPPAPLPEDAASVSVESQQPTPSSPSPSSDASASINPDIHWTRRNKIEMGIIVITGILTFILLATYVSTGIQNTEHAEEGYHQVSMHEYPQITQDIVAVGGSPTNDNTSSPYLRMFTSEQSTSSYFDVKLIAERIPSPPPTSPPFTLNLTIATAPNATTNNITICSNEWVIKLSAKAENEFYETLSWADFQCANPPPSPTYYWVLTTNHPTPVGAIFDAVGLPPLSNVRVLLSALLLVTVYAFIIWDIVHRTLVALIGSFLSLFLLYITTGQTTSMERCIEWMDEGTLALLFGMMIMVNLVSTTGLFEWLAVRALELSGGRAGKLLLLLSVATAVLSAFLDNVTTMLLFAPVTVELCNLMVDPKTGVGRDPTPFLLSEVVFSNLGGASTMIGDPPNIIIGSMLKEYVGFVGFIVNLMPCIILCGVACAGYLRWHYREMFNEKVVELEYGELRVKYAISKPVLLCKSGTILGFVVVLFFLESVHHVTTAWVAVIGATCMMLVATPHELHAVLESVEWDTLLFFAALFVMIEAMAEMGLIAAIGGGLSSLIELAEVSQRLNVALVVIVWVSAIASGFVDNIPFTTTMVPVVLQISSELGLPVKPLIWALALGACLGGNLTIIGASANLVTAGIAESAGYHITFLEFMKLGAPVTFISVSIAMSYCLVVYGVIGFEGDVVVGGG